jgi:hypothetical protein
LLWKNWLSKIKEEKNQHRASWSNKKFESAPTTFIGITCEYHKIIRAIKKFQKELGAHGCPGLYVAQPTTSSW